MLLVATTVALLTAAQDTPPIFEAPVRLAADTGVIDTGESIAHSGPLFADWTGDGLPDLLVGNFRGTIQLYANTGTRAEPEFEDRGLLQAPAEDGAPQDVRIKNW